MNDLPEIHVTILLATHAAMFAAMVAACAWSAWREFGLHCAREQTDASKHVDNGRNAMQMAVWLVLDPGRSRYGDLRPGN